MVLLSGVVGLSRRVTKTEELDASFGAFDAALASGKLPTTGKVSDRLVRSAFAALERKNPSLQMADVPNPLPAPHNLAWYFGSCACPDEVRAFATQVGKKNVRVWSVAQDTTSWRVLAQVFNGHQADLLQATDTARGRLKAYTLQSVNTFKMEPRNVSAFTHDFVRGLLGKQTLGEFIEFHLSRR